MENYEKLAKELIEDHIAESLDFDATMTRKSVLEALLEDTQDVFGSQSGSRTCNAYEAQAFINESNAVFDDDIISLYSDISDDLMSETLCRGAEVFDVVTLELIAPQVISEMLGGE